MTKICLLGFTVSDSVRDEIMRTDRHLPAQTHNFAWATVSALRSAGLDVRLISVWPVTSFPGNRRVLFRTETFKERGIDGLALGFVNVVGLKHLTRFLACLFHGSRTLRKWRSTVLLVHGVHSPFLWYAVVGRWLLGVKSVVLLTDPPGVCLPEDHRILRILRAIDRSVVRAALRHVDAVIALTHDLAHDFASGKPALIMDGISAANDPVPMITCKHSDRLTILYAGGLRTSYGVDRLVEAVAGLEEPEVELQVYGNGELTESIRAVATRESRIHEPQLLAREDLLAAYRSADLLVQPRPKDQDFVKYSFPSKLIEYMTSGTPVLTTRLTGIGQDYGPYVYWIDDDSSEGIRRAIRHTLQEPEERRRGTARRASEFIASTRSTDAQGRRIRAFLQHVTRREESKISSEPVY